jgi:hypothetical protein
MPKTSRDTKKDCGEQACPNDYRRKMLARWDEMIEQARFRCWHETDMPTLLRNVRS